MSTKVKIKKVIRNPINDKPGLVDIELEDGMYNIQMTVEVYEKTPGDMKTASADFTLYSMGDYDVFKDEEEFTKKKEKSMAPQSLIPIGSFTIGQDGWKKSPEVFINGKVLEVVEDDENYYAELECLNVVYYAIYKKGMGVKPEEGNIVSSGYWDEMEIQKEEQLWS